MKKHTKLFFCLLMVFVFLALGFSSENAFAKEKGKLALILYAPSYRQLEAEAIAQQLIEIGVDVRIQIEDKPTRRSLMKSGDYEACLTDWGSAYFDPFDLALPKLSTGGRGNFSYYSNSEVDELLQVGASDPNIRKRKDAYHKIQQIVFEDAPWVFGYALYNIEATLRNIKGYVFALDGRINLHDVELKGGDTIIVGMNTDAFKSLDPAAFRGRETETMLRNMFDALVTRTANGKVVSELAEEWKMVDPQTYVFTLRDGVTFHNGDPFTANDVVFTFERVLTPNAIDGASSPRKGLLGPLEKVEKIDDAHVRFTLSKPFPAFLQALVHFQIVPKKHITEFGYNAFIKQPIGTGPFEFVGGKLDDDILMKRFDGYYGGAPDIPPVGPAKVKYAIFRCMPEPSTRVAALLSEEITILQALPAELVQYLVEEPELHIYKSRGTRSYQIELNNTDTPFNDERVRRALNYAIDWNLIIKIVYYGYAERLATCFLPSGFGYDRDLKPYRYNPEKAKQLLREAGYSVD